MNIKEIKYFERTIEHIHRVQLNMKEIITKHHKELGLTVGDCRELAYNVMNHDRSKFSRKQFGAYIELNDYYRIKKTVNPDYTYPTEEIKNAVALAVVDHYEQENHHVESNAYNVNYMSKFDLIEVCCDLQAMAQEFKEGSCRKFWVDKWLPKYNCGDLAKSYMDKVICCFESVLIGKELREGSEK